MRLRSLLHGVTALDVLFAFYVTLASLFFVALIYDFAAAWFAPACVSAQDLGWWCLPIGFEGPFGDSWANRSFFNARVAATADLIVVGLAFFVPSTSAFNVISDREQSPIIAASRQ